LRDWRGEGGVRQAGCRLANAGAAWDDTAFLAVSPGHWFWYGQYFGDDLRTKGCEAPAGNDAEPVPNAEDSNDSAL